MKYLVVGSGILAAIHFGLRARVINVEYNIPRALHSLLFLADLRIFENNKEENPQNQKSYQNFPLSRIHSAIT